MEPFGVRVGWDDRVVSLRCQVVVFDGVGLGVCGFFRWDDFHGPVEVGLEVQNTLELEAADALAGCAPGAVNERCEFTERWGVAVGVGVVSDGGDRHYLVQG